MTKQMGIGIFLFLYETTLLFKGDLAARVTPVLSCFHGRGTKAGASR